MNKTLHILLVVFILQSCSYYTLYSGEEKKKSITDIPLQPHTHNVDIYFKNDKPAKPYYNVQVIDTTAPEKASYEELLNNLKLKAKHVGADGLIILDKDDAVSYSLVSQQTGGRNKFNTINTQQAFPYQRIAAIGLKYAANIDYLPTIVKATMIIVYDSGSVKQAALNFDFYGNAVAEKMDKYSAFYYSANIEPFDIAAHLKGDVAGWEYGYD